MGWKKTSSLIVAVTLFFLVLAVPTRAVTTLLATGTVYSAPYLPYIDFTDDLIPSYVPQGFDLLGQGYYITFTSGVLNGNSYNISESFDQGSWSLEDYFFLDGDLTGVVSGDTFNVYGPLLPTPGVQFESPTPNNNTLEVSPFIINVSINDSKLSQVTYRIYNSSNNNITSFISPKILLNSSLALFYPFNNNSNYGEDNTTVFDYSGTGNDGTIYGPTYITESGKYGKGMYFSNESSYISPGYANQLAGITQMTLVAWVNLDNTNSHPIISRGYQVNDLGYFYLYSALSTGRPTFAYRSGSSNYNALGPTTNYLSVGTWKQVAVVAGPSSVTVYVNGVAGSSSYYPMRALDSNKQLLIGRYYSGIGGGFVGSMDDVMIFKRALSSTEIAQLYTSQLEKYPPINSSESNATTYSSTYINTGKTIILNSTGSIDTGENEIWNLLINQTGLSSNSLYQYYITANNQWSRSNSTESRSIGNSAPYFYGPSYVWSSPNASNLNDLDPGQLVSVDANITDSEGNLDRAILQWRNSTGDWNNVTMENKTIKGIYTLMNASFVLPSYEDTFYFKVIAFDTLNLSASYVYSPVTTLNSFWDCTWTITSSLDAAIGYNENKFIGNLTLNNTGDVQYSNNNCSLSFRLTHNLVEGRIYFDSNYFKPSDVYSLNAKSSNIISINSTFLQELKQENLIITTTELYNRSSNYTQNTTAILVSNQRGPYLYQAITGSPNSVYLTSNNFSLEGYLRNLMGSSTINENNTAHNVSFYWTLPSGLINISGNISVNFTNITNNNLNNNNLLVGFSNLASMNPGVQSISLSSYGYNSSGDLIKNANNDSLLTNTVNITFLCYTTSDGVCVTSCGYLLDPDCSAFTEPVISGGGGGGGSGGTSQFFSKFIKAQSFELVRGKNQSFTIEFENPYKDGQLTDLKINLTGFLAQYISISPSFVSLLKESEKVNLTAKITAPAYFTEESYDLKLVIEGKYKLNTSSSQFTAEKVITLRIFEVSRSDSESYLNQTASFIKEMNSSKFNILKISNLYSEMLGYYEKDDFTSLKKNYDSAKLIYTNAIDADKQIKEIKDLIVKAESDGLKTPETGKLLALAESAFLRGAYDISISRLKEAKLSYALEVKGEFNVLRFVQNNPLQVSGGVIALACLVTVSSIFLRYRSLKRKLKLLGDEEDLLIGLMRVVQRECFELKKLSMEEYQNTILQYEARLSKVIQEKIESETKLSNVIRLKGGRKKSMEKEADRLKEMIKETQKKYFEFGKLETRIYENMIKSYISKLSDVEEKLATIEAHEQMKKFGFNTKQ